MSDPTPPKPQPHHGYQSYTSVWRDDNGVDHCKRWGRVGKVTRAQANAKYRHWMQHEFPKLKQGLNAPPAKYPVEQLCKDFYAVINKGYHIDDKPTTTITRVRIALESFAALYGKEEADAMAAGKIAAWLEHFAAHKLNKFGKVIEGSRTKETVNLALSYVKRMFRWGMTYQGVSSTAAGAVVLVGNMRADNPKLRRKEPVVSVSQADFDATCKAATPQIRAMIELMWWTGARPGEIRAMRPCDIDTSADVWVYAPARHKNTWRGKKRFIAIGPRARAVLEPILPTKTDERVFLREDGKPHDIQSFAKGVALACRKAGVRVFHPNQIRHSFATRVRLAHGAASVQDLLGHATLNQQQVYIDDVVKRAMGLARDVG